MNRLARAICVVGMFAGLFAQASMGTDIPIFPKGAIDSTALQSLIWGSAGAQGFNNNFFFPVTTQGSVCVYVYNNNPSNPHTFTFSIAVTGNPKELTPSDGTWQNAASANLTAATFPSFPSGLGVSVSGAALVSLNFSASSTQAGSPDTANVVIVQTSGNCFSGNQFIGSAPQTVLALPHIQGMSDGLSQAFVYTATIASPTAGELIADVNANNGARGIYYDRVVISTNSTTAITVTLSGTTTQGSTCSTATPANEKINSSFSTSSQGETGPCTTNPSGLFNFLTNTSIPISGTVTLDLRGFIALPNTLNGISVVTPSAVTGQVTATFFFSEK